MKSTPTDPTPLNNRLIEAVCNGLITRDHEYSEAKAIVEISRQLRDRKGEG